MSVSKRLWDLARANVTDFVQGFQEDEFTKVEEIESNPSEDESIGRKAGREAGKQARKVRDRAEEAWDRAFEAAQERAREQGFNPRRGGPPSRAQIDEWYRTLECESGADAAEVRKAYRKMVVKYHPDRYANEPEKYEAATEVARKITLAYEGLRDHLESN